MALASAEAARDQFAGGAWLVELAATGDADAVDAVIGATLGVARPLTDRPALSPRRSAIGRCLSCLTTVSTG